MFETRLPLLRLAPWFPGQMGVAGSDVPRGLRTAPTGIVLYVDDEHANASDDADGTDPENPLETVAAAVAKSTLTEGSAIVIASEATIEENVVIPPTAPTNVTIIGAGNTPHQPEWTAAETDQACLTVRQVGWHIEGITFNCPASAAGVRLEEVPASEYSAYKTTIVDCIFDGLWGGLYGVEFYGAPHRVRIYGCKFLELRQGDNSAYAIIVTDSAHTNPYECEIVGNLFWENENHIGSLGNNKSFNVSLIQGNVFHEGELITATIMVDMRGGSRGNNIVTGNVFCGDYSNTGGYYAHAGTPGCWIGNVAEDVAEDEVGDNGFTNAVPAA